MDMLRWDPFADLAALRERVNRAFEESMRPGERLEPASSRTWAPLVDIYATERELVLLVDIPGVKMEDLEIAVEGETVTIKGERQPAEGREYLRVERPYGPFLRSFTIGMPVDQARVSARYANGVLEITMPKAEEAQPKRVQVQVE